MPKQLPFERRISSLGFCRFSGMFCANAYKMLGVLYLQNAASSYFTDSIYMLALSITGFLPYGLLMLPAGFLADRFPKRYVMISARIVQFLLLLLGAICLAHSRSWGPEPVVAMLFLLSGTEVFFSPAFQGNLPETFEEADLSKANGRAGLAMFYGAFAGIAAAPPLFHLFPDNPGRAGLCLAAFAFAGVVSSFRIEPVISALQRDKRLRYHFHSTPLKGVREVMRRPQLLLAALGENLFLAIGVSLQMLLVFYSRYSLNDGGGDFEIVILQLAPAVGIGLGCLWAGRISAKKIELGLVPFGAAGVALTLPLAAFFPGAPVPFTLTVPRLFEYSFHLHLWALFYLFLTGLCGGLFLVPIRAYLQHRLRPEVRAAALAAKNAVSFLMILFLGGIVFLLSIGQARTSPELPEVFRGLADTMPAVTAPALMTALGLLTVLVTWLTMWCLPDFALRFLIIALGNTMYRTRIRGAENIPASGPALLLSNHVSFIDGVLISACTSRRVRFLMHEDYFSVPLLSPVARLTGFIRVPARGKHKSMSRMFDIVREALRNGEIICVFPEARITRNGLTGSFKGGYEKMLPPELEIPVIPVHIGNVWGSVFSYYSGRITFRLPREIPYFSAVTFGPPMTRPFTPFDVRSRIAELAAESAMEEYPREEVLHAQVARNAKRHPFKILMHNGTGRPMTAFQVFLESVLLSRRLKHMTASQCRHIGILLPNSTDAAIAILATLYADKIPAPLNHTVAQEVFDQSVEAAGITHIVTSRSFLEKIRLQPDRRAKIVCIEDLTAAPSRWKRGFFRTALTLIPYRELMNMLSPLTANDPQGTAVLLFSSGSTGVPKGVMLSHHNLYADAVAVATVVDVKSGTDKIVGNLPLFHSFGLNVNFWIPMLRECEVIFMENPLDASAVAHVLDKCRPTLLFATPSFLQTYLRKCTSEQLQSLRNVYTGAEQLRADLIHKYRELSGGREIIEAYGCTETAPVVSVNVPPNLSDLGIVCGKRDSIGLALSNVSVKIVDPLTFQPVPPDTEGLLFVKGPNVMQGYLNRPDLTKKAIIDGYYNTGDVAVMDESGFISIRGRLSRFSKIAGEMVPHEMVERIIGELFRSDTRCVAVGGMPDPRKGEALLVLYTDDMPLTPEQVVEQMREMSISNLWIPKAANFRKVEHLPLLGTGKLDLSLLRRIAEQTAAKQNGN